MIRATLFFILSIALVEMPAINAEQPTKPRKVAFLVGIGDYDHKFSSLGKAPENDVNELAKTLSEGGFEIVLLTGSKSSSDKHRATKANIEARFSDLLKGTNGKPAIRNGDTVLVVLCGHGIQEKVIDPATGKPGNEEQPLFCPVDARPDDTNTMIPLLSMIRKSESFGATSLFLVDACREVPPDANRSRSGIQGALKNVPPKTAVLFACGAKQLSNQNDNLGGRGHGLFTYAVLKVLKGETGLKDEVSWAELVAGVGRVFKTSEYQKLIPVGKPQTPVEAKGETEDIPLLALSGSRAKSNSPDDMAKKDTSDEWISLFNGKDLTGWKLPSNPNPAVFKGVTPRRVGGKLVGYDGQLKTGGNVPLWEVRNGILIGSSPVSHLFSEKGDYADFHFRVEAKINDKGNSGQYFRAKFGPLFPDGYEAQITGPSSIDPYRTGSLYPAARTKLEPFRNEISVKEILHKADEFFVQEVIAQGNHIQIFVNGKKTVDFKDPNNLYTRGHLALQAHNYGTVVMFKKIEYKPIK